MCSLWPAPRPLQHRGVASQGGQHLSPGSCCQATTQRSPMDILKSLGHPEEIFNLVKFKMGGCSAVMPKLDYVSKPTLCQYHFRKKSTRMCRHPDPRVDSDRNFADVFIFTGHTGLCSTCTARIGQVSSSISRCQIL